MFARNDPSAPVEPAGQKRAAEKKPEIARKPFQLLVVRASVRVCVRVPCTTCAALPHTRAP